MSIPKLGWNRLSVPEQLVLADYIVLQMTNNVAVFAAPIPALADITAATVNLRTAAVAAHGGGLNLTLAKKDAEKILAKLISSLTGYVTAIAQGDAAIIRKAGFDIRKEASPTPNPIQVENLNAYPSRKKMVIDLNWDAMEFATAYQVEQWEDSEVPGEIGAWIKVTVCTKSKYSITGLETGKIYKFRVAAIGTGDRIGPFSQDASSVAS